VSSGAVHGRHDGVRSGRPMRESLSPSIRCQRWRRRPPNARLCGSHSALPGELGLSWLDLQLNCRSADDSNARRKTSRAGHAAARTLRRAGNAPWCRKCRLGSMEFKLRAGVDSRSDIPSWHDGSSAARRTATPGADIRRLRCLTCALHWRSRPGSFAAARHRACRPSTSRPSERHAPGRETTSSRPTLQMAASAKPGSRDALTARRTWLCSVVVPVVASSAMVAIAAVAVAVTLIIVVVRQRERQTDLQEFGVVGRQLASTAIREVVVVDDK